MITVGIDEVGRGCWAGPLLAGAVILEKELAGLRDSKQLSPKARERLATQIYESGATVGLGWVSPAEVDALGLTAAVRLAMQRAWQQIDQPYDDMIIDGNLNFLTEMLNSRAVIKADGTVPAVSAASIVAKVARDAYMVEQAKLLPAYGFDKHVGYGTAMHLAALKQYGLTELHRKSYKPIKALLQ